MALTRLKNRGITDSTIADGKLSSTLDLSGKTVSYGLTNSDISSLDTGKVLQAVTNSYSTDTQTTSDTLIDTGLSASITPSSTSSKILVLVSQLAGGGAADSNNISCKYTILRGSTALISYKDRLDNVNGIFGSTMQFLQYLDSPSTTSATTYKTQFALNGTGSNRYAKVQWANNPSYITLLEIAG